MPLAGYIKLYRSLLDWSWHDDPETLSVWVHLLLQANFTETTFHGRKLHPGQVITGRAALAKQTGLTERKVRTALERLKSTGAVTIETTSKYSVITIEKYSFFQGLQDETDQQNDQQNDQRATSKRPATDHTVRNIRRKDCKENGEVVASAPRTRFIPPTVEEVAAYCKERRNHVDPQRFCDFYESNGWKVGKNPMKSWQACIRTWERRGDVEATKGGYTTDVYAGIPRL